MWPEQRDYKAAYYITTDVKENEETSLELKPLATKD